MNNEEIDIIEVDNDKSNNNIDNVNQNLTNKEAESNIEIIENPQNQDNIDDSLEIVDIIDKTKPQIVKEKVVTKQEEETKENKSGMFLVITILLILILVVLFLPQISNLFA